MTGFKHPALKQLTDQQVRFAPSGPSPRADGSCPAIACGGGARPAVPLSMGVLPRSEFRPESYPDLLISTAAILLTIWPGLSKRSGTRFLPPRRPGWRIAGRAGDKRARRAAGYAGRTEQAVERLGQDDSAAAQDWAWWGVEPCGQASTRICFQQMVIDRFLTLNRDRVERGGRFSQMNDTKTRRDILRKARLSRVCGGTLTEISRRIARRLGRSVETVRYTIKNFDRENPEQALFPHLTGPLDAQTKQSIYSSYRRGMTVDTLAKRFQRTRTSMYRVINEVHLAPGNCSSSRSTTSFTRRSTMPRWTN